jgi:hypothetical protein
MEDEPPVAALANNRIIINTRGGLTDDKPRATLQDQPTRAPRLRHRDHR